MNIRNKNIKVVAPLLDEPGEVTKEVLARLVLSARADKKFGTDTRCIDWDGLGNKAPTVAELTAAIAKTKLGMSIVDLHRSRLWFKNKTDEKCLSDEIKQVWERMKHISRYPFIADL